MNWCVAIAFLLSGWAVASVAQAQEPDWSLDVGAAARVRPFHVGAGHYTWDVLPIVEGRIGDRISLSFDDGLRWAAFKQGSVSAGPVLEYRQAYNDKLPRLRRGFDGDLEFGGFTAWETAYGEGEVRLRKSLTGYRGWSGDLAWDVGGSMAGKLRWGAEARASWIDGAYLDRQFGLPATSSGTLAFHRGDTYSAGLEIGMQYLIAKRLTASLQLSDDHILGAAPRSALFRSRDDVMLGVGVAYRFGRMPTVPRLEGGAQP